MLHRFVSGAALLNVLKCRAENVADFFVILFCTLVWQHFCKRIFALKHLCHLSSSVIWTSSLPSLPKQVSGEKNRFLTFTWNVLQPQKPTFYYYKICRNATEKKKKDGTLGGSFKEIMIEWGTSWTKKEGEFLLSLSWVKFVKDKAEKKISLSTALPCSARSEVGANQRL